MTQRQDNLTTEPSPADRRCDRRLEMRLNVDCRAQTDGGPRFIRGLSQNISTRGILLEADASELKVGDHLQLELTMPPSEGVSSQESRIRADAEILRIDRMGRKSSTSVPEHVLAARFVDKLRFTP